MLIAIAAIDNKFAIGKDGGLLADIKTDMAFFRRTTMGHTVVLGRKTLATFPGGRPLPKRKNIILTRDESFAVEGGIVVHDVPALMKELDKETEDVFVIGGGEIYSLLLPYCQRLILTEIEADLEGEVFFPRFDKSLYTRREIETHEENGLRFTFVQYDKK